MVLVHNRPHKTFGRALRELEVDLKDVIVPHLDFHDFAAELPSHLQEIMTGTQGENGMQRECISATSGKREEIRMSIFY